MDINLMDLSIDQYLDAHPRGASTDLEKKSLPSNVIAELNKTYGGSPEARPTGDQWAQRMKQRSNSGEIGCVPRGGTRKGYRYVGLEGGAVVKKVVASPEVTEAIAPKVARNGRTLVLDLVQTDKDRIGLLLPEGLTFSTEDADGNRVFYFRDRPIILDEEGAKVRFSGPGELVVRGKDGNEMIVNVSAGSTVTWKPFMFLLFLFGSIYAFLQMYPG